MINLFIKRPVLAITLNAFIVLLGLIALKNINISEYPEISIPKIKVGVVYPGASMQVIEQDIAFNLEEELSSISGLDKMNSSIGNGYVEIWMSFKANINTQHALADIRDRISHVKTSWPKGVLEPFIDQEGKDQNTALFLSLISHNSKINAAELTHLAKLHLKNQIQSIPGVASIRIWGAPYMMDINLDRPKLAQYNLSPNQILTQIKNNQVSLSAGKFHGAVPINFKLNLETAQDFENIIIKSEQNSFIFLKDISQINLISDPRQINQVNNLDAAILEITRSSDGNPLEISKQIKAKLKIFENNLPKETKLQIEYDSADFIKHSLSSLAKTILEACLLVILIIFVFLRNFRATLVPIITIPISLLGAIFIAYILGFSINTLSLLALVLSIGLVVDDSIIVVENIFRHKNIKSAMQEITPAIIAMTLTLAAVFAPLILIQGLVGQVLIEFGVTLAAAVLVSGFVALTLSPLMCTQLSLRGGTTNEVISPVKTNRLPRRKFLAMIIIPITLACALLYMDIPKRLMPIEDRGFIGIRTQSPPNKTLQDLWPDIQNINKNLDQIPEIKTKILYANNTWGTGFSLPLKNHKDRNKRSTDIVLEIREKLKNLNLITELKTFVFNWDTGLPGLENNSNGSDISISIQTTRSHEDLIQQANLIKNKLILDKKLTNISHNLEVTQPSLNIKLDKHKAALLNISLTDAAQALKTYTDQDESLEFFKDGLKYKASFKLAQYANNLEEVDIINLHQQRIPLSSILTFEHKSEPKEIYHTNRLRSVSLSANFSEIKNLDQAISYLETQLKNLPNNFSYSFEGSAQANQNNTQSILFLFFLSLLFIFGVLSILFNNFKDPLIILSTVPMAVFGSLLTLWLFNLELDLFAQLGLITLIGLITKHGILIIDFKNKTGSIKQAIKMRLRPILMTTGAMTLGSLPLIFSQGPGAEARISLGIVLVSGLLIGTTLTLWILPLILKKSA